MLFLLGIWLEIEGILDDIGRSENSGNPVLVQVNNFPVSDGEVDQPVYEGPQTQSHSKKLMIANILMDQMFFFFLFLNQTKNLVIHWDGSVFVREVIFRNVWSMLIPRY